MHIKPRKAHTPTCTLSNKKKKKNDCLSPPRTAAALKQHCMLATPRHKSGDVYGGPCILILAIGCTVYSPETSVDGSVETLAELVAGHETKLAFDVIAPGAGEVLLLADSGSILVTLDLCGDCI